MAGEPKPKLGYRAELDGLRGVAVLSVFVWHTWAVLLPSESRSQPPMAGFLGVDIFFVLSGFLITTLLLEEHDSTGRIRLRLFYGRRALRLIPAFALLIAIGWWASSVSGPWALPYEREALVSFTYVANWFLHQLGVLTHTWSLALEEQYYVLWAFGLMAMLKLGVSRRRLAWMLLLGAVGVAVIKFAFYGLNRTLLLNAYVTYGHLDGLLLGNAVALAPELWAWTRRRVIFVAAAAGAIAILFVPQLLAGPGSFTQEPALRTGVPKAYFRWWMGVFVLCVAALIAHMWHRRDSGWISLLSSRPLPAVGRISYGLYLFHLPVFVIVRAEVGINTTWLRTLVAWTASFACAIVSYVVVERPALRLKSRLVPKGREHIPQWEGAPLSDTT